MSAVKVGNMFSKNKLAKDKLAKIKIERRYGINDLKKYILKLKQNIKVFEEAINKENKEVERVNGMIKSLENDIKTAQKLEEMTKS